MAVTTPPVLYHSYNQKTAMNTTTIVQDVGRSSPLAVGALYLNFISQYGTAVVTTLAIVYGVMQIILRWREHLDVKREEKHGRK